tara:strand:- start:808 stop:1029 length:222 start_codon:yes stop_codon:yes gene_type:complete
MKKLISLIVLGVLFVSCGNKPIKQDDVQVVQRVNYTENDENFVYKDYKYIVRTQDVTLVTNSSYQVGDTLTIK